MSDSRLSDEELAHYAANWGDNNFVTLALKELQERRKADPSVRLICQLARDVLIERPPLVDPQTDEQLHSNAVHELLRRAVICVDKLLARKP